MLFNNSFVLKSQKEKEGKTEGMKNERKKKG